MNISAYNDSIEKSTDVADILKGSEVIKDSEYVTEAASTKTSNLGRFKITNIPKEKFFYVKGKNKNNVNMPKLNSVVKNAKKTSAFMQTILESKGVLRDHSFTRYMHEGPAKLSSE